MNINAVYDTKAIIIVEEGKSITHTIVPKRFLMCHWYLPVCWSSQIDQISTREDIHTPSEMIADLVSIVSNSSIIAIACILAT